jgi:hypothetical protein
MRRSSATSSQKRGDCCWSLHNPKHVKEQPKTRTNTPVKRSRNFLFFWREHLFQHDTSALMSLSHIISFYLLVLWIWFVCADERTHRVCLNFRIYCSFSVLSSFIVSKNFQFAWLFYCQLGTQNLSNFSSSKSHSIFFVNFDVIFWN